MNDSQRFTARQATIRRHSGGRSLRRAVRLAAYRFFRFTHRSTVSDALWSETERVWLGEKTFMHWAMCDPEIDIPRTVDTATNAPEAPDDLQKVVRAELTAYWADRLTSLPRRDMTGWVPLP
jgi:hypothetical protein